MPLPVLSVSQMREWEARSWAAGRRADQVIEEVGRRVAAEALRRTRPGDSVLVLAGKGNNGADARAALPHLRDRPAWLLKIHDPPHAMTKLRELLDRRPSLVIDGLFGIGLSRELSADWRQLIEVINRAQVPVLAVDVPSGLDAQSGQPRGAAIRARFTLAVAAPKTGLVTPAAGEYVGRLMVAPDVGLVDPAVETELSWTWGGDFLGFPPSRPVEGHKGTFGHLVILAGGVGYHGAAVLAARAAQRAMPGLVSLYVPDEVYAPVAAQLQSVMVHPVRGPLQLPPQTTAILFGPGLASPGTGEGMRRWGQELWRQAAVPVVADASGLDGLPLGGGPAGAVRVLTPHPGEAGRMLGVDTATVQADRLAALRALSSRHGGAWVVLKGRHTLSGQALGRGLMNSTGNPHLAQGGSGDVLAGWIGGWLAQPALQGDAGRLLSWAAYRHGEAADRLSGERGSWRVEELVEAL